MAVRISSGTRTNIDSLEVHLDQPTIEADRGTTEAQTTKDTSEDVKCHRGHGWHNITEILREAGIHE